MSKEYLEALDWLEEKCYVESPQAEKFEECCKIIRQSLHRLECIDNANPSEALECLDKLTLLTCNIEWYKDNINTIKQALIKAEKEHKALEIIKSKNVVIRVIKCCKTVEMYNTFAFDEEYFKDKDYARKLTQEEFILLKAVLGC